MNELKYPKNEIVCTSYFDNKQNLRYIITSKLYNKDYYYLYEYIGLEFKKLGRAKTPIDLENKFKIK